MVPGADFTSAAERGSPSLYRVTDAAQEHVSPQASAHAQNALRRITTHETGEGIDLELDGLGRTNTVDDNYEEQDRETNGDGGHGCPTTMVLDAQGQEVVEKAADCSGADMDKTTLQDQTNLLPTKQVLMVFVGLTASIFCSLLDQTMCVLLFDTFLTPLQCYHGHPNHWKGLWSRRHILLGGDGVPINFNGEQPGRGRVTPK